MDEQNGYNDMDLVIDAMIRDMNDNQLALLRTLAYGPASYDYVNRYVPPFELGRLIESKLKGMFDMASLFVLSILSIAGR